MMSLICKVATFSLVLYYVCECMHQYMYMYSTFQDSECPV